jgi:hypothetical protein
MSRHTGRLVLTTADPQAAPASGLVQGVLTQAGFIGAPLPGRPGTFAVGPELLGLLSFAGCSVVLPGSTQDQAGEAHCHVRIAGPEPMPRLIWGRNTRGPRCPKCRARLTDWQQRLTDWIERPLAGEVCPKCGGIHPPWRWDWKQQGGFGRLFVLVEEVFPGEAVPTQPLFDLLTRACGVPWRHFYQQD